MQGKCRRGKTYYTCGYRLSYGDRAAEALGHGKWQYVREEPLLEASTASPAAAEFALRDEAGMLRRMARLARTRWRADVAAQFRARAGHDDRVAETLAAGPRYRRDRPCLVRVWPAAVMPSAVASALMSEAAAITAAMSSSPLASK